MLFYNKMNKTCGYIIYLLFYNSKTDIFNTNAELGSTLMIMELICSSVGCDIFHIIPTGLSLMAQNRDHRYYLT